MHLVPFSSDNDANAEESDPGVEQVEAEANEGAGATTVARKRFSIACVGNILGNFLYIFVIAAMICFVLYLYVPDVFNGSAISNKNQTMTGGNEHMVPAHFSAAASGGLCVLGILFASVLLVVLTIILQNTCPIPVYPRAN